MSFRLTWTYWKCSSPPPPEILKKTRIYFSFLTQAPTRENLWAYATNCLQITSIEVRIEYWKYCVVRAAVADVIASGFSDHGFLQPEHRVSAITAFYNQSLGVSAITAFYNKSFWCQQTPSSEILQQKDQGFFTIVWFYCFGFQRSRLFTTGLFYKYLEF